ncbi:efflux RND transporter periplasmic adaptor subunit [Marinobacter sp. CA1]|uniref:efflux RND transporter periplasmic adaptor subunit n=1 Tax=Marinobacter sp. CA1 TaxID=2817656 RepID=UPI001D06BAD6|nr:efflux RND transporter periplasmic adaptor subunit [Marinobacter sp. CA1]UDL06901.1 efflux RND transporter periplasmic adaptor subunit [Marinobacter sp. CA1]
MSPTTVRPGRRRRLPLLLILIAALAIASVAGWLLADDGESKHSLPTAKADRGDVQVLVSATGVLEPNTYVDVGAQVSGQLDVIHVRVGERVKEGELLAEIDPTIYTARVDATRAQLRNQQAQLEDRKASLKLAQIQYRRQGNLMAEDATTEEALQSAEAGLASARAQVAMLEAQIEQTSSTLRAEEANLDYARIYAPMDGTVVSISARQGQALNAVQQAPVLMRIADLQTMRVRAQVSEADIGRLMPGMAVYFTTLGNPDDRIEGTLDYVEPTPEVTNNVVLYNALFRVPNSEGRLLPQMTAKVFFVVKEALDVVRVPATAIHNGEVQLATAAGSEPRKVEVGISNRVHTEVRQGLAAGDEVLLKTPGQAGADGDRPRFRGVLR